MRWGLLSTAMINQDVAAAAKDSDEARRLSELEEEFRGKLFSAYNHDL